jgi:hypothetical protein
MVMMKGIKYFIAIGMFLILSAGAAGAAEKIVQLTVPGCFS